MALLSKEMDLEGNVNDINDDRDTDSSRNISKLHNWIDVDSIQKIVASSIMWVRHYFVEIMVCN